MMNGRRVGFYAGRTKKSASENLLRQARKVPNVAALDSRSIFRQMARVNPRNNKRMRIVKDRRGPNL